MHVPHAGSPIFKRSFIPETILMSILRDFCNLNLGLLQMQRSDQDHLCNVRR